MYTLQDFICDIKKINNLAEIEFEIKLLLDKQYERGKLINIGYTNEELKILFKSLFARLNEQYLFVETQTVNIVSKDGFNKQLEFKKGEKIPDSKILYTKTKLKDQYMPFDGMSWKLKVCREHRVENEVSIAYTFVRFKRRYSCVFNTDWRIDYTFVIQISNDSAKQVIIDSKNKLFFTPIEEIFNVAGGIEIEIEIEYIGNLLNLTEACIHSTLGLFNSHINEIKVKSSSEMYNESIHTLKKMFEGSFPITQRKLSIKQLLPQVQDMSKKQYYNIVSHDNIISDFYVTNKIDGERCILYIKNNQMAHQVADQATCSTIQSGYLTANKWIELNTNCKINYDAILDCEFYDNTFYIFDILWYRYANEVVAETEPSGIKNYSVNLYMCPFLIRLEFLRGIVDDLHDILYSPDIKIVLKIFVKLDKNYPKIISSFVEETNAAAIPTDGLIFTSLRDPYLSTQYFKWKPANQLSIDFIAKACPNELLGILPYIKRKGMTLYILFVGIRSDMCAAFGIKKLLHCGKLFPFLTRHDYFPIQFSPSSDPNAYLFWSDDTTLDNQIVELIRITDPPKNKKIPQKQYWKLLKIRKDRFDDYQNMQYFGNDYRVAELIWNKYQNPFNLDLLTMSANEMKKLFYFVEDDSLDYKPIRKFNNYVKERVLETRIDNVDPTWVTDIGTGKGQDYMKYIKYKVSNALFIDSNINNIDEIISRKYTYFKQGLLNNSSMNLNTLCCDAMSAGFDKVVDIVHNCKLIVCNFAIHYMVINQTTADIFAQKISSILTSGGRLIITYLNGKSIFAKLALVGGKANRNAEWNFGKYSFKRNYITNMYTGSNQKIKIKLPFSNGYYDEYLFNLDSLTIAFKKYKITEEYSGNFRDYIMTYEAMQQTLNKANKQYSLSADDKEYISLVEYTIFYRKSGFH